MFIIKVTIKIMKNQNTSGGEYFNYFYRVKLISKIYKECNLKF